MSVLAVFRARLGEERGAVAVIVALLLVVLVGSAAMTFDLARLRHERHVLQSAVDLGSLAGAAYLPVSDGTAADVAAGRARDIAEANAPALATSGLQITFGCVVSDPEADGGDNSPDLEFACGPTPGVTWSGGWEMSRGRALHSCNPYAGDLCNTIRLTASGIVQYFFAPILGNDEGSTGAVRAAACRGYCGQASAPLDVVFVIDRTGSMTPTDIANLKDAIADTSSAEDSVLEFYDPNIQRVGFTALPYHHPVNTCAVNGTQVYPEPNPSRWQPVGPVLSSSYRNVDGSINTSDAVVGGILCLQRAGSPVVTPPGAGHTDHGDPIASAHSMLNTADDIPDVIVFFADGEANQPRFNQPCNYAWTRAQSAKAAGVTVFSLGYGVGTKRCNQDRSGPFANALASTFLAAVASPRPDGTPSLADASCSGSPAPENTDGDNYFCESLGEDLEDVFRLIAIATIERTRLLDF